MTERIDESPSGRFIETVIAAAAQLDNDVRGERTVAGMKEAASRGRFLWKAPLGYRHTKDRLGPSLEIDPDRGPLVRGAFELYDSGLDRTAVLAKLQALGLRMQQDKPLTAQSLHNLLKNPIYIGMVRVPRWSVDVQGDFSPLVPEDLFLRVQARLSGKRTGAVERDQDDPTLPLRRFLRCATCATPLTGSRSRGRSQTYPYYRCRRGCSGVSVRADVAEEQFLELLDALRPRPEYLRLFKAIVQDCWRGRRDQTADLRATLERRIESARGKLQRVEDAFLDGKIDQRSYIENRDRLREELAITELQVSEARNEHIDIEGVIAFAEHVMGNASALWTNASPKDRRALQTALFPQGLAYGPPDLEPS